MIKFGVVFGQKSEKRKKAPQIPMVVKKIYRKYWTKKGDFGKHGFGSKFPLVAEKNIWVFLGKIFEE